MTGQIATSQLPSSMVTDARATPIAAGRDAGLDMLRAATTLLVVFHHTAITYGAMGGWFYREVLTDGRLETKFLILFCSVNQAWFMGLFFLLAGYFTPPAFERKGAWSFARDRLLRLGLPLLIFGVLIGPATIALAQSAKGRPFTATLTWLWERGTFESGPLWFCQTLLLFCLCYLVWRVVIPSRPTSRAFPSNGGLFAAAFMTGAAAFALRLVWPVGTEFHDMQLGYFASYIVLFLAGCVGARGSWLRAIPENSRRGWLTVAWLTVPVLPAVVLLAPLVPALRGDTSGGWNIQAMVYAFWEPFVAWGFILALVHAFQRRFKTPGPICSALARRAYTIFIIHPPILVGVALVWRDISAPHLVKFAVTATVASCLCFWIAGWLLRIRWVRQVI